MPFLIASPALGLALLAAVLALILAIHRLRPRAVHKVVPSLLLWQAAARAVGQRAAPWTRWVAVALSLAIGTLLVLPLTRVELQGVGDGTRRTVIVVDAGPSMASRTRDGQTRWLHALATARALVRAAPGPVLVMDTSGRGGGGGFVAPADALPALDRLGIAGAAQTAVPMPPGGANTEIHVVSDGVSSLEWPQGAIVHSVFERADNVGVIGLTARSQPTDGARIEALVQIVNVSPGPKSVRVALRGEDDFSLTQSFRMAAGERIDATFDISAFAGGVLAAAARTDGDAVPGDDIAYTAVERGRGRHITLVTAGNAMLADALRALPHVRVEVVPPARYREDVRTDVFVFDDFTPPRPPPRGVLLFRPHPAAWLPAPERETSRLQTLRAEPDHPLVAAVRWDGLAVTRSLVWTRTPPGVRVVVRAEEGALVMTGAAQARWVAVGFRPGDSNLPLQGAFPVFLASAIDAVVPREELITRPLGLVRAPVASGEVRNGQGETVPSRHVGVETLFQADRADLFTVRSSNGSVRVAAMPLEPASLEINRTRFGEGEAVRDDGAALPLERWAVIAVCAVLLLCLDWAVFARRLAL